MGADGMGERTVSQMGGGWFDPLQMKPTPQRPELSFLFLPGIPMRRETT